MRRPKAFPPRSRRNRNTGGTREYRMLDNSGNDPVSVTANGPINRQHPSELKRRAIGNRTFNSSTNERPNETCYLLIT